MKSRTAFVATGPQTFERSHTSWESRSRLDSGAPRSAPIGVGIRRVGGAVRARSNRSHRFLWRRIRWAQIASRYYGMGRAVERVV